MAASEFLLVILYLTHTLELANAIFMPRIFESKFVRLRMFSKRLGNNALAAFVVRICSPTNGEAIHTHGIKPLSESRCCLNSILKKVYLGPVIHPGNAKINIKIERQSTFLSQK